MIESEHANSAQQTKSWKAIQAQVQSLAIKAQQAKRKKGDKLIMTELERLEEHWKMAQFACFAEEANWTKAYFESNAAKRREEEAAEKLRLANDVTFQAKAAWVAEMEKEAK